MIKKILIILWILFSSNTWANNVIEWKITSDWWNGFCYNIIVNNNTSENFIDWKIHFELWWDTKITSNWSGQFTNNKENYTITSLDWNKKVLSNGKIEIWFCWNWISRPIKITFLSNKEKNIDISQPIKIQKNGLMVEFMFQSKRDEWYCKKITLKNIHSQTIFNWNIWFTIDQKIDWWSAKFLKNSDQYSISPFDWNKEIKPNEIKEIWFCTVGKNTDLYHEIQNVTFETVNILPPVNNSWSIISPPVNNSWSNSDITLLLKYPTDSWNPKKVDLDKDGNNDFIIELNPWNISKASGIATMSVDYANKSIIYNQDLSNISIKDSRGYVLSYPEIYVWNKPHNWQYIETKSKLPILFSSLKDLDVKVNYKLNFEPWLPANLAMEWWLTKNKFQSNWVGIWESELMIWLYSSWLNPAGQYIWDMNIELKIDGVLKTEVFEIYKWNIGWEVISFRPKNWGWLQANIELNVKQFFDKFKTLTSIVNFEKLFFQNWEIGTETGSPSTTKAKYDWQIFKFDITGILSDQDMIDNSPISNTGNVFSGNIIIPKNNILVWYYPTWARYTYTYDKIDYSKFDIINFAFIYPNADGTLEIPNEAIYPELINEVHKNGKKIVISIWWWTKSYNFPSLVSNLTARNKFINEVKKYIVDNKYDGVDLDWEFPNNDVEWKQFIDLLKDLKTALWKDKIVSTAISINPNYIDIEALSKVIDYVYIMSYDIEGWWNGYAWHNAPLYKNSKMPHDFSINYFLNTKFFNKNIDKTKFLLWFPFYGRKFNVSNPYMTSYYSDYVLYNELPKNCFDNWDNESKVPYLSCGNYYISYDNAKSLNEKVQYMSSQSMWGLFIWALGQDNNELVKYLSFSNSTHSIKTSSWSTQLSINEKNTFLQILDKKLDNFSKDKKIHFLNKLILKLEHIKKNRFYDNEIKKNKINEYIKIIESKF